MSPLAALAETAAVEAPQPASVSYVDFSESLGKGAGFKYHNRGDYVDFRLKGSGPALPVSLGAKTFFNLPGRNRVEYTIDSDKIKEDIILDSRPETDVISFDFTSSDLAIVKNPDGSHSLYEIGGAHVFDIEAPTIVDAKGKSGWISLDIDKFRNTAALKIEPGFLDNAAYPVTVDPTTQVINLSAGGVGLGSQRNTFYHANEGRWWVLYSNGTYIRASYSTNGTSWTQSTNAGPTVNSAVYFSSWFDGANSVYIAYRKTNTHSIYVRKGTVNATSITWGPEYTALHIIDQQLHLSVDREID